MEENKENVVEEVVEQEAQATNDNEQEQVSAKEPTFMSADDDSVVKINLDLPVAQEEDKKEQEQVEEESSAVEEVQGEADTNEPNEELKNLVEEVTNEEEADTEQSEPSLEVGYNEQGEVQVKVPGNLEKLVEFMNETGGSLEDYVNLNKDYAEVDNETVLIDYYRKTKPHLSGEEISFLMDDQFNYDEEVDDEREIKRKKLALKEQVANAKAYLDGQKSKYYEEIKASSNLTKEQQEAINFFKDYNLKSEETKVLTEKQKSVFNKKTNEVFNDKFKGFEYNVGDKRYRFKVNNVNAVKQSQSDLNNFLGKFLGEDQTIKDAAGYHKSLFTAMNADAIAKHFYEQGKADAIKESVSKAKNVDMTPRSAHKEYGSDGIKVRILGDDSSDFKFKIKKNN